MRTSARISGAMAAAAAIAFLVSGCGSGGDGGKDDKPEAGKEKSAEPTPTPSEQPAGKAELPGVWSTQADGGKLTLTVVGDAVSLLRDKKMCNGRVMSSGAEKSLVIKCPGGAGEDRTNGTVEKVTAKSLEVSWNGGATDTYAKVAKAPAKLPKDPGELGDVPGLPDKLKKITEEPGKVRKYPAN
ncbi:hypothetical protein [Streptomyces sp. 891-h]|uniref:hypothetical protein n=1 Tax=Streptomyces sp. 891-h TaxID=2720714 RepID=UPI001FA98F65|nr:hypothetical protein [Streptomyces sp. 891-h]UNZ17856.1 hypothetical protein HC362_13085 [Streptomyces sp. 891-h]